MRAILAILISLTAGAALNGAAVDTARADQYKWCAIMGGGNDGGMTNCYFVTLAQCQAYVSGVGGYCQPSPFDGNNPASSWDHLQSRGKKKS